MLNRQELVHALIGQCEGHPGFGRTILQKLAYLATESLDWDDAGHRAHFYGPFSAGVERTVDELVRRGDVDEVVKDLPFTGASGFRAKQFEYRLTDAGRSRLKGLEDRREADLVDLQDFLGKVEEAVGGLDQRILSLAAKVHYIVKRSGQSASAQRIIREARELGWRITPSDIKRVTAVLEQLELIRKTPT